MHYNTDMNAVIERILCIMIGYFCGCFLPACVISRIYTGKDIKEIGMYGNPGMANVMANIGFLPGILVLLGDLAKVVIAVTICWNLFHQSLGDLVYLYAGTGASLGHCYPFWRHFQGGKAVTTICATIILYSFPIGVTASLLGLVIVLITHFLSIGGTMIPVFFAILSFLFSHKEAGWIGVFLALLAFSRHAGAMKKDLSGTGKKTDLLEKVRKKTEQ